jgi:hypothetical protein
MKKLKAVFLSVIIISCNHQTQETESKSVPILGTWKLLTGTLIEKGDTTVTDYTKNLSFIKIINQTHFAFLQHDTRRDSTNFSAGGGSYSLKGNNYTENLEYCSSKEWEGHSFNFTINLSGDTLVQSGDEVIEDEGINRTNIEKYVRVKNQ